MNDKGESEYHDQRQVERKYLVFYLRVFEGMSTKVLGHVVNLSSKGVLLLSDLAIPVDKEYRLRMKLPTAICERGDLLFRGTSRWSKRDVNPEFYLTGFKIHDLNSRDKLDILNLLDEFSILNESKPIV